MCELWRTSVHRPCFYLLNIKNISEFHLVEIYVRIKFYIIVIICVNVNLNYDCIPYEKQSVRKAIYMYHSSVCECVRVFRYSVSIVHFISMVSSNMRQTRSIFPFLSCSHFDGEGGGCCGLANVDCMSC
jgi:hypothetical protein